MIKDLIAKFIKKTIAHFYLLEKHRNTDGWISSALRKKEYRDKPYLGLVKSTNYVLLKKVDTVINQIEKYRLEVGLERKDTYILDVGCGSDLIYTMPLTSLGYRVLGIDIDEDTVARAKKSSADYKNVEIMAGDAIEILEKMDKTFDAVLAFDVLEHMKYKDAERLSQIIAKRLKPGGFFYVITPDGYSETETFTFIIGYYLVKTFVIKGDFKKGASHIERFTLKLLEKMITNCGLKYEFITGFYSTRLPFILTLFGGLRGYPMYLNIKLARYLPKFMTNSWLVCGRKG